MVRDFVLKSIPNGLSDFFRIATLRFNRFAEQGYRIRQGKVIVVPALDLWHTLVQPKQFETAPHAHAPELLACRPVLHCYRDVVQGITKLHGQLFYGLVNQGFKSISVHLRRFYHTQGHWTLMWIGSLCFG